MFRDIVRPELGFQRAQGAAYDLFDLAGVQVDAWPEASHFVVRVLKLARWKWEIFCETWSG